MKKSVFYVIMVGFCFLWCPNIVQAAYIGQDSYWGRNWYTDDTSAVEIERSGNDYHDYHKIAVNIYSSGTKEVRTVYFISGVNNNRLCIKYSIDNGNSYNEPGNVTKMYGRAFYVTWHDLYGEEFPG